MVTRTADRSKGNRKKYRFELTSAGRRAAQTGWRPCLSGRPPADIDSVLRIIDMALHYGANRISVSEFALKAAEAWMVRSQQHAGAAMDTSAGATPTYLMMRSQCEHGRLKAEAKALEAISRRLASRAKSPRRRRGFGIPAGQQLLIPPGS